MPGLKSLIQTGIRYSGAPWLMRHAYTARRATVLLYHDPGPETLDLHLAHLTKHYAFITMEQLVDALHDRDWSSVPRNAMVVTLDDGHRNNAALGPVFRRYGVRPMIYLCSQIVATHRRFWTDLPEMQADYELCQRMKRVPNAERLELLEQRTGYTPVREYEDRVALTQEEILEMREWADLGAHTQFHPILTTCSASECEREIVESRREIEKRTGLPCEHFCYPNGDYTRREVEILKKDGFRSSRTCDVGWVGPNSDPYRLKTIGISDDASVDKLVAQLTGIGEFVRWGRMSGRWRGVKPPYTIPETEAERFDDQR